MDRLCATCGKQLQPDHGFCESCGAAWTPVAESASAAGMASPIPAAPQPVTPQMPVPAGGGRSSKTLLLIVAILAIAMGIAGWLFLRNRTAAESAVVSSSTVSTVSTAEKSSTQVPPASSVTATEVAAAVTTSTDTTSTGPTSTDARSSEPVSTETVSATAAETEAAASSKPCSLVTRAEMEKILGSKIVKVTNNEQSCSYFTDDKNSANVDTIWTGGKESYAQVKGFNSAPGLAQPVAGIGDEAYLQAAGVLHVLKGETYVVVNSRAYPNELAIESAIARKVMEKLQ